MKSGGHTLLLAALSGMVAAAMAGPAMALPTFDQVRHSYQPSEALLLDRDGEVIQRLRMDKTRRQGQWTALQDVSPALRTALVLSEDKRFYAHSGVDWQATTAAAWANLWNRKTRGASTITMQLAALLDSDLKRGSGGRSVVQKVGQALAAQQLERHWRKDQVLEAYLNLVPLRGELVGIEALSQTLFGKEPHGLDNREAAVTAALVRAPNANAARVAQRACGVLRQMEPHRVDCFGLDAFTESALQQRSFAASEGIAPHLARRLISASAPASGGTTMVRSTLRAPLQRFAVQTLHQHLRELQGRHVQDGAIVVLDNASGEVLAWVGSSGELSQTAEFDNVTAPRQAGSTLKPFLYAQAIAERRITAASLLDDSGTQIQTGAGLYIPQNYDQQFKGWVSARTALAASLNVPAVRTLVMVTPEAFHQKLNALGLGLPESGDYYGYSLALGSAEVSLLRLSNAYRTLANGGRYGPTSTSLDNKTASRGVLDSGAAFIVGQILSDSNARAPTFGTDSLLATRFWSAVKTGTSKDMRDNWAVGYSQRYTVGVWVGNSDGAPMWDVSGTTGAAPIWAALMGYLHASLPSRAPLPPAGVVQQQVQFAPAGLQPLALGRAANRVEAARSEWFLRGTQQTDYRLKTANTAQTGAATQNMARILSPTNGSILALDPDIPPQHQLLTFRSDGAAVRWMLDGKLLAQGPTARWLPWPGKHVVQLQTAKGLALDEVSLEVRGAGLKAKAQPAPRRSSLAPHPSP